MTWFGWTFVVLQAIGAAVTIGTIGTDRQPLKPSTALVSVMLGGFLVWGAVSVGTTH